MKQPVPLNVQALVDELIKLDPTLAEKRTEVERALGVLIDKRIESPMRPAFQQELLVRLRSRMAEKTEVAPTFSPSSFFSFMNTRFLYAGSGALVGALLVFVVLKAPALQSPFITPHDTDTVIEEAGAPEAFGPLTDAAATSAPAATPVPAMIRNQSGGGGSAGLGMPADKMMVPPMEYQQLRFTYDGDIELPTSDVTVYQRVRPTSLPGASSAITGFSQDLIDWSKLGGLKLQNVSLMQSGTDGYSVYVDYAEGSLSINKNYSPTSRPDYNCTTDECYQRNRIKESDMLPDAEVMSIAESFLEDFGIDRSSYGEPQITDNWRLMYARSSDKLSYYFPEQVSVVFPLVIDGKEVYEEYGNPYGLNINVDIRTRTVASLYNQFIPRFDSSTYAPATDEARLREVMSFGSVYGSVDPNAKYVDAKLGEPTNVLLHHYSWNQQTQTSRELFVPALKFPVQDLPAETFESRTNVVVPLAAELLKNPNDSGVVNPRPMPLMMEDKPADQ